MTPKNPWSRRQFLATSAMAAAAAGLPAWPLRAQTAKYTRYNLTSSEGQQMLTAYQTAVTAMLALPPTDARNWYRITLIHTLDCPHGNWWFLPWHRGYIGYVEEIVRQYSGNPSFAFPYWDWTTQPEVPASFFGAGNPLDPTSSFFIKTFADFKAQFETPVDAMYAAFTPAQNNELWCRGLSTPADLWAGIDPSSPGGGFWFNGASARCLTAAQPSFASPPASCAGGCAGTPQAVAPETIEDALAPTDFLTFGSGAVCQHSESTQQGVLESQPHNLVHNCVGGFMSEFMSPVDPIFFMHHSNIERLWLEWTAKQESIGEPTLPTGPDLPKWESQPFLFYVDTAGQTLSRVAGDFKTVGAFDYTYAPPPGAGLKAAPRKIEKQTFEDVAGIPAATVEAAAKDGGPELFAHVPIDPQGRQKGKSFHVLLNPPEGANPTDTTSPHHVATVAFFGGGHGHAHGTTIFVVNLSSALRKLKAAGKLDTKKGLHLFVATDDHAAAAPREAAKVVAVPVKAKVASH